LLIHVKEDQGSGIQVNLPRFLDPRTFRPIEAQVDPQRAASGGFDYRTEFRASPDGQTFAMWHLDVAPHGLQTIQVGRNAMALKNEHSDAGYLVPGCDGRVLFTQLGLYSLEQLKPLQEDPRRRQSVLPAHSGNFYVTFAREESKPVLNIAVLGDEQPLIQLRDIDGFTTANSSTGLHDLLGNRPGYNPYYPSDPFGSEAPWNDSFSTDKRFHLMPEAKLIVLIPTSNDRLVLHRFDIEEALEKSGREFLVVVSQSPAAAYKGTSYRYPIRVKSKRGGVKYKLEAGPTAMSVSRDGTITWQVPAGFVEAETNVMVSIRDAAGQERLHSFTLPVREAAAADNRNPAKQASSKPDINLPEIDDVKEEKGSPDEPKQQTPTDKLKREATAKGKLKLAQQLLDKKRVEAAKKYLRDIVEHYPDTEAAGEARRLLEHLKSPE
jgi:hypothetical protein